MEKELGGSGAHEAACKRVAAHFQPAWLRKYVESKLRSDPVFEAAHELLHSTTHPILDLGCGVGILAFYLRERGCTTPIQGIDLDERKIQRAQSIGRKSFPDIDLRAGDALKMNFDFRGNVTLFDVLHYLPEASQKLLLSRLAECVAPGALVAIRDCPNDGGPRYWTTFFAEKFAQLISWNLRTALHFPARKIFAEALPEGRFTNDTKPLWGATPFNNHLFVFRRRVS